MPKLINSFRVRILIWTVAVSGLVLIVFGLISGAFLYRSKLASIDERLEQLSNLRFPHPDMAPTWSRVAGNLSDLGERSFGASIGIIAYKEDRRAFFASDNLKDKIDLSLLPEINKSIVEPEWENEGRFRMEDMPSPDVFRRRDMGFDAGMRRGGGPRNSRKPPMVYSKQTFEFDDARWRFFTFEMPGFNVAVGVDLKSAMADMNAARSAFLLALPIALAILAGGAWFFSSRAIRPLNKMTLVATSISARNLSERIPVENEDKEFQALGHVLNSMLERLESSFAQATRFSADAAHELKTPLAILQGHLEGLLQDAEDGSTTQRTVGMLLEETQRLSMITRKLLLLARVDAGQLVLQKEDVDLVQMIEGSMEDFEMQASYLSFKKELPEFLMVQVDKTLFRQILQNLLANAVKYNWENEGVVGISLKKNDGIVEVDVFNTGDSIPLDMQNSLFERFVRGDQSRNRKVDGIGLGLSLSMEFARAHGASLSLCKSDLDGTVFRLSLPV